MSTRIISDTIDVDATPAEVFEVLTDTARHAEIDGSGSVQAPRGGGTRLTAKGDTFGMSMKVGLPYPITNTVVEFEQDRLIAWRHFGGHRWRYELEPLDDGARTRVTESFDWSRVPVVGFLYEPVGIVGLHRRNIPATLERLQALFA